MKIVDSRKLPFHCCTYAVNKGLKYPLHCLEEVPLKLYLQLQKKRKI